MKLEYLPITIRRYAHPTLLDTLEKVAAANRLEKLLGSKPHWKLGDRCYYSIIRDRP